MFSLLVAIIAECHCCLHVYTECKTGGKAVFYTIFLGGDINIIFHRWETYTFTFEYGKIKAPLVVKQMNTPPKLPSYSLSPEFKSNLSAPS